MARGDVEVGVLPQQRRSRLGVADRQLDRLLNPQHHDHRGDPEHHPSSAPAGAALAHPVQARRHPVRDVVLGDLRRRQDVEQQRHQDQDGEDVGEAPEAREEGDLAHQRDGGDAQHQDARGVGEDADRAGQKQLVHRVAHGLMAVAGALELLEIALEQLHAVARGPRGHQQWNDQHQDVEVVAEQSEKAESPDDLRRRSDYRQQHSIGAAKIEHQRQHDKQSGDAENFRQLALVVPAPGLQHRLAGGVHDRVVVFHGLLDAGQAPMHLAVVDLALVEPGGDHGARAVGRNQDAVGEAVQHVILQAREVGAGGRNLVGQQRPRDDQSAAGRDHLARVGAGDGVDQVVIDAVHQVELLMDEANLVQRFVGKNVAVFDLQLHGHHVGGAEDFPEVVVGRDVRMGLRQQIAELAIHPHRDRLVSEEDREHREEGERKPAMLQRQPDNRMNQTFNHRNPVAE